MEDQVGQVLHGRYLVESVLAQGGMGVVYSATDQLLGITVAVKKMLCPPDRTQKEVDELCQQFVEEARTLARLQHPHLVRVIDFFTQEDAQYLVMDFAEGESLYEWIRQRGKLPEAEIVTLAGQLLDALDYCHRNKIYHRDVKPRNVIIGQDGRAKLVDFGLVKLGEAADQPTRAVIRGMGTPEYAPPEQVGSSTEHTDARSDIYSLGATLYHGLTGHAPPTVTQRVSGIERLEPIRTFVPRVSSRLEQVVLKALELKQDDRWQSAQEMAGALGVSGGTDVLLLKPTEPPPVQRDPTQQIAAEPVVEEPISGARRRRRRLPWAWLGAGALAIAVVGILLATGTIPTALSDPTSTPTPTVPPSTKTATATLTATSTPEPSSTPTRSSTSTATPALTSTPTEAPAATSTPTEAPTPTLTPTAAPSPTDTPRWLAAPSLVAPEQGAPFTGWNALVMLQWSNVGPLSRDEYYVVRIPYDPAGNTAAFWRKDLTFQVPAHFSQANVGFSDRHYNWTVQVMRCTSNCDKALDDQVHKDGYAVGTQSAQGLFYWHPGIPGSRPTPYDPEVPTPTPYKP